VLNARRLSQSGISSIGITRSTAGHSSAPFADVIERFNTGKILAVIVLPGIRRRFKISSYCTVVTPGANSPVSKARGLRERTIFEGMPERNIEAES